MVTSPGWNRSRCSTITGPSSAVGGWGTSLHSGSSRSSSSAGERMGRQTVTIVAATPASLWTCFSRKSSRVCISMNDRRVG